MEWTCRKGKLEELDSEFDYEFWRRQSPTARFATDWELVLNYHINILGEHADQLRLQRSLVVVRAREG